MEIASIAFLLGVFWFMRHWHRFCEFNADLTAAVAGYGTELIHFLKVTPDVHTTGMKRRLGVHPSVLIPQTRKHESMNAILIDDSQVHLPRH